MGGCLSSSPGGGAADTAVAVKGQAYQTGVGVEEPAKQQVTNRQQQEVDKQQHQRHPGSSPQPYDDLSPSCPPGTDDGPVQNSILHNAAPESSSSTVVQPASGAAKSPDLQPLSSSINLSSDQIARARPKASSSETNAFPQQAAPEARTVGSTTIESASSTSARPTTHAEKSAAAAAKKPRSLKSRLLAAANLESIDREAEATCSSTATNTQQSTADAPDSSSPFATPQSRTPFGGSAGAGAGYPSSRSSSRALSAAAGLVPAASAPGARGTSSRAMALQAAGGAGPASALMSQVETRLIEAEQLLGQHRNIKQGNSESSLTKPPEMTRPPTREEMMRQLDLAEKKLMGMKRKEGGSGYA